MAPTSSTSAFVGVGVHALGADCVRSVQVKVTFVPPGVWAMVT